MQAGDWCMVKGAPEPRIVKVLWLYRKAAIVDWRGMACPCPVDRLLVLRPYPHPLFPYRFGEAKDAAKV